MAKARKKSVKKAPGKKAGPPKKRNTAKPYMSPKPKPKRPRKAATKATANPLPPDKVRIQKYLADLGIGSRRSVEQMIEEGMVEVNGEIVVEMPCFVTPGSDVITVDGQRIHRKQVEKVYYLLNKPKGVFCTSKDQFGRTCVNDLLPLPFTNQRVYCVGRLDAESTGAIILTNDGDLTQHLTHPSNEVPKTYLVTVRGKVEASDFDKIKKGVYLDGRRTAGAMVKVVRRGPDNTTLEMTLREGRNREIRRTLLRLGYKVRSLKRIAIGKIGVKGLGVGNWRILSKKEVEMLYKSGQK